MGKGAKIKLEDKDSDQLFKEVPIETYPGLAIQSVTDSSRWLSQNDPRALILLFRYFVIKTTEEGRSVFLGLGFEDRSDSFDLQTTLHDYFKGLLVSETAMLLYFLNILSSGWGANWTRERWATREARPCSEARWNHQGEHQHAQQEEGGQEQVGRSARCGWWHPSPPGSGRQHPRPSLPRNGETEHCHQTSPSTNRRIQTVDTVLGWNLQIVLLCWKARRINEVEIFIWYSTTESFF